MFKLKSLIVENDASSFQEDVKKGNIIDSSQYPLWRGVSKKYKVDTIAKIKVRRDRNPRDTDENMDKLIEWIRKTRFSSKFPSRHESVFATTSRHFTRQFGIPHMCFLPKQGTTIGFEKDSSHYISRIGYPGRVMVHSTRMYELTDDDKDKLSKLTSQETPNIHRLMFADQAMDVYEKFVDTLMSCGLLAFSKEVDRFATLVKQNLDKFDKPTYLTRIYKNVYMKGWDNINLAINDYFYLSDRIENKISKKYKEIMSDCDYYYLVNPEWAENNLT